MTQPQEDNPQLPESELAPHVEPPPRKHIVTLLIDEGAGTIELFQHLGGNRGRKASVQFVKLRHGLKLMVQLLRQMLAK